MKLRPDFEIAQSNMMNHHPISSLDACLSELLREEQHVVTQVTMNIGLMLVYLFLWLMQHMGGIRVETCVLSSALVEVGGTAYHASTSASSSIALFAASLVVHIPTPTTLANPNTLTPEMNLVSGKMTVNGPKVGQFFPLHVSPSTIIPSFPLLSFACSSPILCMKDVVNISPVPLPLCSLPILTRHLILLLLSPLFTGLLVFLDSLIGMDSSLLSLCYYFIHYFYSLLLQQAMEHKSWQSAMQAELQALEENHTWDIVPCPPTIKPIGSKWVFSVKLRSDGSLDRYKARLVALGLEVHHRASDIFVNQHKYIQDLITLAGLEDTSSVDTLMEFDASYAIFKVHLLMGWFFLPAPLFNLLLIVMLIGLGVQIHVDLLQVGRIMPCLLLVLKLYGYAVFLRSLGFLRLLLTPLHVDNTSAIQIATNPIFHERTKHIEVDCHSIRDILESWVISLPHISSDLQVSNVFTKALTRQRHQFLVGKLLLVDLPTSI
ncbi:putative mitochondrial protein [Vitis vinifera]|uniref:Putative mitochondrial protein n=1 Tax=Vitis vinifera TaxID=29760 RepID=A0A438DU55_VITVI|nr:putative mitochondrial protein [Vitis vinifera]